MSIQHVDEKEYARVWGFVQEIGEQERHFNGLEGTYRTMASSWLLAMFAAVGFVITELKEHDVANRAWLVFGIALAGGVGIGLLWMLDLLVYHRLLHACFVQGLELEKRYRWLPPVRHEMVDRQPGLGEEADDKSRKSRTGITLSVVWFYILGLVACGGVAGGGLYYALGAGLPRVLALVADAVVVVVAGFAMWWASRTDLTGDARREATPAARPSARR